MINRNDITNEISAECNVKCPYIPDHPYRILITGGSASGKINSLLNLLHQQDIDKIYLYAKNLNEPKYQLLINKHEHVGIKHCTVAILINFAFCNNCCIL